MIVARWLSSLAGVAIVVLTLRSALRTVVIPRAERTWLAGAVFGSIRRLYGIGRTRADWRARDRRLAGYPAVALLALPFVWVALVLVGFAAMFWAIEASVRESLYLSGTSITTLGSFTRTDAPAEALAVIEATIGLGIVALLISFLPTLYAKFSQREEMVALLEVRAGTPPSPSEWFLRAQNIGWMDVELDEGWAEWERWFLMVEEAHLSYPALNFFRSPSADRSWITAAGVVLDTAALRVSVIDLPRSSEAQLCIRAGFLTLRQIAAYYGIPFDPDPDPTDPISITRAEFDTLCDDLMDGGVVLRSDRDQAWIDYAGWRVNYDTVLVSLCELIEAPPATWSSDRLPRMDGRSA